MVNAMEIPRSVIGELGAGITSSELRETAYEILIGACRSSTGSKPLTYIPQSERNTSTDRDRSTSSLTTSPSLQRSLTSAAASKVKKALGISSGGRRKGGERKSGGTVGEMIRVQMRVSEQIDSRVRRAFLRIAAGQLGRRIESIVVPLELLQQLKQSDFPNQQEFEAFQKRSLKLLEAGLLLYPYVPLDKSDNGAQRLKQIIRGASEKPIMETGKNSEFMQVLRTVVMTLSCRSFDDQASNMCHWADGFPLNLHIYQVLLEACFDVDDETSIIEEVDEVLELIKKTWVILGMNQELHNLCFLWTLFHRYVETGEIEDDLLFAASNLLAEVENDAKTMKDVDYSKVLSSSLSAMLGWAEKQLLTYHDTFSSGNVELMQSVATLAVTSAKILVEDISHEYRKKRKEVNVARDRVETYIRSSIRTAFAQKMEKINLSKSSSKNLQNQIPVLSLLAQEVTDLALSEKEIYSPIFKRWHPLSAAADRLEKQLVQVAVEDAVESDDGGKSIIKEMPPYDTEAVWNVQANKERVAPSLIEVLRIVDETLEAFFLLPIPMQPALVTDLTISLDRCLQHYILKAKSGCGTRKSYLPSLPGLTRCSAGSKFFKKKEKSQVPMRRSQVGSTNVGDLFGISQLCVRINSMQRIRSGVDALEKRTITYLKSSGSADYKGTKFELSIAASFEAIHELSEITSYKIVFQELSHVLWDGLYVGEVSSSRIELFLQELEHYLETIATTVHDRVRTRLITEVMKASFEGFLLVLVAGGPSRSFTQQDSVIIEEDFKSLCDLFWSNGDGLPSEVIDRFATTLKTILPVLRIDTESLIEQLKQAIMQSYDSSAAKSRLPLPPTTGEWDVTEPNTLLRILCHRDDELAAKFLKRTYGLPTKLS
ncbi:hypothetical protein SOVF_146210 [Spinacia oleracea]|nr:hypothetical protein SOVF_146210 [Spinacia oleracea]